MPEGSDIPYRDILDRIKYEDEHQDHTKDSLTPDQKTEIALFHSIKQDPYYRHYIYNSTRVLTEDHDDTNLTFPDGPYPTMLNDHVKFDRINIYDFRRDLPQKERLSKLDKKGCAWGFGKRKTSKAVVRLKPGNGTIKINGKSMLDYFHLPSQRFRILLPLSMT